MKSLRYINMLNFIYAAVCLLSMLGSSVIPLQYMLKEHVPGLAEVIGTLFPLGPAGAIIATFIPFGPIACIVGIVRLSLPCKETEQHTSIGRKLLRLFAWLFLDALLWWGAVSALVGFTGGV